MNFSRLAYPANPCGSVRQSPESDGFRPAGIPDSLARRAAWRFLAAALAFCLMALAASALALELAWNPNPEPDVTGYELSYGTSSGSYTNSLSTDSVPSATIPGLLPDTIYYFSVRAVNSSGLKSPASAEISYRTPAAGETRTLVSQAGWSLLSVDSEETNGYAATRAFDGNPATFWHTAFSAAAGGHPHEIRIDLGTVRAIKGFIYLPRQDGLRVGNIIAYEFFTSLDGTVWSMAVSGSFENTTLETEVAFSDRNARYVALRAVSGFDGTPDTNIAELNLIEGTPTDPPANTAPVAASSSVTTAEDTAKTITLSATDADKQSLTWQIVAQPTKGTLSGTAPNLTYTPQADFGGSDSFTFRASDGTANSNTATISINVSPVNDVPVASAASVSTSEDTAKTITLSATDKDNSSLTWQIVAQPTKGTLSGTAPNLTYTPQADFSGSDSFTFRASDGTANSNTATISINVSPVNDAPVAAAASVSTSEDTAKTITLSATDKDNSSLTWQIVAQPTKGTLSGTAPNLTYTPQADFSGSDSFTFRASDGTANSNTATVSINVSPVNDAPVAAAASVSTSEDTAKTITLSATDKDNSSLTWQIVAQPTKGTLSGTAPNLTYTPQADFSGSDSFTFRASDGTANSNTATISINVSPVNDAPVAAAASVSTSEDTAKTITLSATDKDNSSLTWQIVAQPTKGTLSGTAPNLTYTPQAGFNGSDSFTFLVNDGTANSNTASVSITVIPSGDSELLDRSAWTLVAVDSEEIPANPGTAAFDGNDSSFWHTQWTSNGTPPPHEITISLGATKSVRGFRYLPRQDGFVIGNISDFEFLTSMNGLDWGTPAATGTFENTSGLKQITFSPRNARFIRLRALGEANGSIHTAVAELNLLGGDPENQAPVFHTNPLITSSAEEESGYRSSIANTASDPDGDPVTFAKLDGPAWLTVSTGGILGGTPPANSAGTHRFTLRVTDPQGASATARLVIAVAGPSLPPQWDGDAIGGNNAKADIDFDDGVYRLRAAGRLSGRRDSGAFASQTLTGDGQIIARVTSMRNAGANTRAGLMIRDSLNPGSRHVFIGLNGKADPRFVRRSNAAPSQMKALEREGKRHFWLKLVRKDNTITAFTSPDGKTWTEVGSSEADFGKLCHIGLYVAGGKGKTATASFRNVRVNP